MTIIARASSSSVIYIDCETQESWEVVSSAKVSRNDYIQNAGESFPVLSAGSNTVGLGSGITRVVITPRWWRL
jgi:phage-related protein